MPAQAAWLTTGAAANLAVLTHRAIRVAARRGSVDHKYRRADFLRGLYARGDRALHDAHTSRRPPKARRWDGDAGEPGSVAEPQAGTLLATLVSIRA